MVTTIHLSSSYRPILAPIRLKAGRIERPSRLVLLIGILPIKGYIVPEASHKEITPDARSGRIMWRNTYCYTFRP
jgi:hypothetical protein